jgi:hypothetical protein
LCARNPVARRDFMKTAAGGAAALVMPMIIPARRHETHAAAHLGRARRALRQRRPGQRPVDAPRTRPLRGIAVGMCARSERMMAGTARRVVTVG